MDDQKQKYSAGASMVTATRYMGLAFVIPMGAAAGWIVGKALDSKLKTTYWMAICICLGVVGGFIQVAREVMREMQRGSKKP